MLYLLNMIYLLRKDKNLQNKIDGIADLKNAKKVDDIYENIVRSIKRTNEKVNSQNNIKLYYQLKNAIVKELFKYDSYDYSSAPPNVVVPASLQSAKIVEFIPTEFIFGKADEDEKKVVDNIVNRGKKIIEAGNTLHSAKEQIMYLMEITVILLILKLIQKNQ